MNITNELVAKDKNGKTMKIGDIVKYTYANGEELKGKLCYIGYFCKIDAGISGYIETELPDRIELVEPDTQEKINADVSKSLCDYWGIKSEPHCYECEHGMEKSGTPCEANVRLDLLRRQRELDSVK
jgi:hypothetical protein